MERIKSFGKCFYNLLIYVLFISFFDQYITPLYKGNNLLILNMFKLIGPLVASIVLVIFNKELFKDRLIDFKKNNINYWKKIIIYWIIGALLMTISTLIISLLVGAPSEIEELNRNYLFKYPLYTTVTLIVFTPICEEIIFRGSFKKALTNKYVYCTFTALFFALMHVYGSNILYIIPYTSLALFFAKVYFDTDNIYTAFLMHAIHNTACILLIIGGISL